MTTMPIDTSLKVLRRADVLELLGIRPVTLYRWVKDGKFPAPMHLGAGRIIAWRKADVEAWLDRQ